MSSSSRRSRNSLAGGKQTSTNQRPKKRNAKDAADEGNLSFGSNVSLVFKGDESFEDQEEDEQQSEQRAGKLQKFEHNSSISEASENAGSSRPVRQAALKSRRSLTATIAATTRRRQSARLSQNFKAELGARAKSSMAEELPSASAANGSAAHSSAAPATIGSVGNLFAASSSGIQHQAGPSNQSPLIFNQHLALNPNQSKDRRLSLPAKCFSQMQQPAPAAHLHHLEVQKQQMVQQCQQASGIGTSAAALPYHRSSTSQPLDDVTAALLNKEHHTDVPRLQQQQKLLQVQQQQQQQKILQLQQLQTLQLQQHQKQLQLQQQKQLPQHSHLQLQQGPPESQTSVSGNSSILNYHQQQQPNVRINNNGAGGQMERSVIGSAVPVSTQANIVYQVSSGGPYSGLTPASFSTSNFTAPSSSVLISQHNSVPIVTVSSRPSILLPGETVHPIGRNGGSKNYCTNSLINGSSVVQNSSEQRLPAIGTEVRQASRNNGNNNTSTSTSNGDNGGRRTSISVQSRVFSSNSNGDNVSFNDGGASDTHHSQQARSAAERGSSNNNSSDDDVVILEEPRSVTPEAVANNSRNVFSQASSSSSTTSATLHISCPIRPSPLPRLTWADRNLVWRQMCLKDRVYKRNADALQQHPAVHQRMRAILLDWLSEVCEVYALHRETYYLAIDYIDRYLMVTHNVPKQQLQLLGITCLFIAAKVEEIYPPKISEFAYVTDGACRVEQITEKELVVVRTLSWHLSPLTINTWLNTYLQLLQEITRSKGSGTSPDGLPLQPTEFVYQRFSGETFVQICRLLDLCILDTSSLHFSPALLAAAALSYFFGSHIASKVSSFTNEDLKPAQKWMKAFAQVVQSLPGPAPLKSFRQVASEDSHNIQTKVVELDTLDLAKKNQEELQLQERLTKEKEKLQAVIEGNDDRGQPWGNGSPPPVSVLTPPKTDEKRDSDIDPSEATSDHLIHSSCPSSSGVSSSGSLEGDAVKCDSFSNTNGGMGSVAGHAGGHRPVVYNGSDAMEVS